MDAYDGYAQFQGWSELFSCDVGDAIYYQAEMRGMVAPGRWVLEIGFGRGAFLRWARDQGAQVQGIEIQEDLIRAARDAGFAAGNDLDGLAAQFPGHFDLVVAFDVLEHLDAEELRTTMRAVSRLLKPDGRLLARFPNGMSPFSGFGQNGDLTHKTVLTPNKLRQICAGQGMEVVEFANRRRTPRNHRLLVGMAKRAQASLRDLCNCAIARIYGLQTTVLDPDMVAILRPSPPASAPS